MVLNLIHKMLNRGYDGYAKLLESYKPWLSETVPWREALDNPFIGEGDAFLLYSMIATVKPPQYIEIGCGFSTLVATIAISHYCPDTSTIAIDPEPRTIIVPDVSIKQRLEDVDWTLFNTIPPNSIVFFDGSHVLTETGDVATFFLEVLPRLPKGTYVQVHDIFLPDPYPSKWADRKYTEQYMLALYLLFAQVEILLPYGYISMQPSLMSILNLPAGKSFWFRTL